MKKILAITIGFPGSGKTCYTKNNLFPYERVSQDDDKRPHYKKFLRLLLDGKPKIVIDRTNMTIMQRLRYVLPARYFKYKITYYLFKTPIHKCIHNMKTRKNHPTINPKDTRKHSEIIERFQKEYEEPQDFEYDELVEVSYEP